MGDRLYAVGESIRHYAWFTASALLKDGLADVTVTVYDEAGVAITATPASHAHEITGTGIWYCDTLAAYVDAAGSYVAKFITADATVDCKEIVDIVQVRGIPFATEDSLSADLTWTLAGLLSGLRYRLNDSDMGNYLTAELQTCINIAYRETVVAARCHRTRVALSLGDGTFNYDLGAIFEPITVSISTNLLDKVTIKELAVKTEGWDTTAEATPTCWMHYTGGYIRVYPTPNTSLTAIVYGYARPTALSASEDIPVALSQSMGVSAILDRAEAEARKMRSTTGYNSALYDKLMDSWKGWVALIRASVKAED